MEQKNLEQPTQQLTKAARCRQPMKSSKPTFSGKFNDGDFVMCSKPGYGFEPGYIVSTDKSGLWWRYHIKILDTGKRCRDVEFDNLAPFEYAYYLLNRYKPTTQQHKFLAGKIKEIESMQITRNKVAFFLVSCYCGKPRQNEQVTLQKRLLYNRVQTDDYLANAPECPFVEYCYKYLDQQVYRAPNENVTLVKFTIDIDKSCMIERIERDPTSASPQVAELVANESAKINLNLSAAQSSQQLDTNEKFFDADKVRDFVNEKVALAHELQHQFAHMLERLRNREYYTDSLFDFYMKSILTPGLFGSQNHQKVKVQVWSRDTFYQKFHRRYENWDMVSRCTLLGGQRPNYQKIAHLLHTQLDRDKHLVIIVNLDKNHWVCVLISAPVQLVEGYKPKQQIYIFDSLFRRQFLEQVLYSDEFRNGSNLLLPSLRYLSNYLWNNTEWPELISQYGNLFLQPNFVDCGCYALEYATYLYYNCQSFLQIVKPCTADSKCNNLIDELTDDNVYRNKIQRFKPDQNLQDLQLRPDDTQLSQLTWPEYKVNLSTIDNKTEHQLFSNEDSVNRRKELDELITEATKEGTKKKEAYFVRLQKYVLTRWEPAIPLQMMELQEDQVADE